jgi:hypothetical protein
MQFYLKIIQNIIQAGSAATAISGLRGRNRTAIEITVFSKKESATYEFNQLNGV